MSRGRLRAGRHPGFWIALAVPVLVLLAWRLLAGGDGASTPGDVYDFRYELYQGQEEVGRSQGRFADLFGEGKPVVLNFWAGLCPPCRAEMPAFERVYREYRGQIILFGLDVGPYTGLGSREDGIALMRELGVSYPSGSTEDGSVVREYRLQGMPTTLMFTSDGRLFDRHTGLLTEDLLRQRVEELTVASAREGS